jgi:hypothetical protein
MPNSSKESFGGFVGFQGIARDANPILDFPNFLAAVGFEERAARGRVDRDR